MIQDNEKLLQNKLDRAKKDLKFWKSMNDKIGQPQPDHPDRKLFFSCEIMDYCDSKELGKCVFYNCHTRPSKLDWKEHHEKCHPKDDILYVLCDECKRIQDEEARFMENCISQFEKKLNKVAEPFSPINSINDSDLESIIAEEELFEGKKAQRFTNYYERNPEVRKKTKEIHGYKCMACGFDFEQKYGVRGSKYIEVHHLKPVSSLEEETRIDPKTEMAVVCSNCHRMIHRKKDKVLSLEELRKIISGK